MESQTIGECGIANDLQRSGCRRRRHILLLSSKGWRNRETSSDRDDVPDETRSRNLLNTSPHPYRCSGYRQCLRHKFATEDGTTEAADNYAVSAQHHDMPQVQPTWTCELGPKTDTPVITKTSEHSAAGMSAATSFYTAWRILSLTWPKSMLALYVYFATILLVFL